MKTEVVLKMFSLNFSLIGKFYIKHNFDVCISIILLKNRKFKLYPDQAHKDLCNRKAYQILNLSEKKCIRHVAKKNSQKRVPSKRICEY